MAKLGQQFVLPNPMVGAILVHDDKIIGEGFHEQYGQAHAEINCLKNVAEHNKKLIPYSTLFVSLEPCNHTGKTPPCTNAIKAAGIKKVIVGTLDINPLVAGQGVQFLRNNNVEVLVGFCEAECLKLNRVFFTNQKYKRAYIKLKWAQTADRFLGEKGKQTAITNQEINIINHKYRTRIESILVGYNTAEIDNPSLNSRHWTGPQPIRIILDWQCDLPKEKIKRNDQRTIVFNSKKEAIEDDITYVKVEKNASAIAKKLYALNIRSVMIEGGAKTHNFFIRENIWDEAIIINSDALLNAQGTAAAEIKSGKTINKKILSNFQITQYSNTEFLR